MSSEEAVSCVAVPISLPPDGNLSSDSLHAILCAVLPPSSWPRDISPSSLLITRHAGHANTNCVVQQLSTTHKVFVKINGALDGEIAAFRALVPSKPEEARLCRDFGLTGRGPRLFGAFCTSDGAHGRVDEFLEDARGLTPADVEDAEIRAEVAAAQATLHALRSPACEEKPEVEYYDVLTERLESFRGAERLKSVGREAGVSVNDVVEYDFASRVRRAVARLDAMHAKKGLVAHDVQYMNVLLLRPAQPLQVKLVDFEFCFRDYRGVDIGGHFLHKLLRWFGDSTSRLTGARPYLREEKADFCGAYAVQWTKETGEEEAGDKVLKEAEIGYVLAAAFEVHNALCYMDEEDEDEPAELEALRMLHAEFARQAALLGLDRDE